MTERPPPQYLTAAEVAEQIRMSADYVARQCAVGNLKAKKLGNAWRIAQSDLDAFMAGDVPAPVSRPRSARQRRRAP